MLASVGAVAVGTLLVYPLKDVAPAVSLSVVYIPGILLISTLWGWRLGLVSALLSALAFNWFHLPPTGRLEIAADKDAVAPSSPSRSPLWPGDRRRDPGAGRRSGAARARLRQPLRQRRPARRRLRRRRRPRVSGRGR